MSKKQWVTEGFEAFRKGEFGNAGQNIYVSKKGVLQRIFQYDLNRNGYIDLVFANCQNHSESTESFAYSLDGKDKRILPSQGALCGMVCDLYGTGYQDIIIPGYYDGAEPFASADIYFGSEEGYSEKYHIRIPTPFTEACTCGDFKGTGKKMLAFSMPKYKHVRVFEQTVNNCFEWDGFENLEIDTYYIAAADLDGDGYDDLICRSYDGTESVIYWGGPDGLSVDRKTEIPALPEEEVVVQNRSKGLQSEMQSRRLPGRRLKKVVWEGKECFTLSTGKKVIFYTATKDREIVKHFELDAKMAMAVAVGDIDGDGYDDIVVAASDHLDPDSEQEYSFIYWNSPDGFGKRERTCIKTNSVCDVSVLDDMVLFGQSRQGDLNTNDQLLFTYPDFNNPRRYDGEAARDCFLVKNPGRGVEIVVINNENRSAIGAQEAFIYWGSKEGYSPENRLEVPCHCAVDAMISDINDDGWAELIVANNSEQALHKDVGHHVHFFGPDGFEPEKTQYLKTDLGYGITAGDIDHDGYIEIISGGNYWKDIRIFSARDNFSTYQTIDLGGKASIRWPKLVDLNKNGWLDLIVPCCKKQGAGEKFYSVILWGGPDGYSIERSTELVTRQAIGVAAADLTKNGYPDLLVGCHVETPHVDGHLTLHQPHHSYIYIYWNGPEGISERRKCILRCDAADHMAIADFNGDGWLDIFSCSYHGGKDRDINSYIYWNREGQFSATDRQYIMTHSASGCMAADFNEDGYIDLAVANHKTDGDHTNDAAVWWNGPDGFKGDRCTYLPVEGPHGMISTEIGNILDRGMSEYYYSESITLTEDCTKVTRAYVEGDIPEKTAVNITVRKNGGEWVEPENIAIKKGDTLQYRIELYAYNCLRTPRITKAVVEWE